MSQGNYSHTTRATGTVLSAAIYNNDHQNHVVNQNPTMTGAFSDTLEQMQSTVDPGSLGSEVLATSLAGELQRIRWQLRAITGEAQWYLPPSQSLAGIGGIGDNSVPLTKLANTVQGKLMGRVSAGAGPWQEFDIPGLTALVPAAGDFLLGVPAAGGAPRKIAVSNVSSISASAQGRLTLAASSPVMTSSLAAQNTIRYTPYNGLVVPTWNGSIIVASSMGGELTQLTTDNTKSPGPVVANSNYDMFFWLDGSTPRISRGPPWSTATSRGTGAGTTELTRIAGVYVNAQAIANGPAALRGTYIGTIRSNAAATIDWAMGSPANGGGAASLNVWNMYNRVSVGTTVTDNVGDYTYTTGTIRAAHNSNNNRISYVCGLDEDAIHCHYQQRLLIVASAGASGATGIGVDSITTMLMGATVRAPSNNTHIDHGVNVLIGNYGIGSHFVQGLELGDGSNANSFNNAQNATLTAVLRM